MPNMCTCGDHYASHAGYNALTGEGGGPCMADRGRCPCEGFEPAADKERSDTSMGAPTSRWCANPACWCQLSPTGSEQHIGGVA